MGEMYPYLEMSGLHITVYRDSLPPHVATASAMAGMPVQMIDLTAAEIHPHDQPPEAVESLTIAPMALTGLAWWLVHSST
jgi:hypothetical protein